MKLSTVIALTPFVGAAMAQGVTSIIAPPYDPPAACSPDLDGQFQITIRDFDGDNKVKRDFSELYDETGSCDAPSAVLFRLSKGVMTDGLNRTGYIASNYQFQFDGPPQAGAIFTAGFSHCANGSLALGASTVFWKCLSGDFYNLYDRYWAEQCHPTHIDMRQCDQQGQVGPNDHSVGSVMVTTTMIVPLADGQPQVITTIIADPICEIDDGQLQGHTTPCAVIAGVQKTMTWEPVSELSDGQIQVTPAAPAPSIPSTLITTAISIPSSSVRAPSPTAAPTSRGPDAEKPPASETKTGGSGQAIHMSSVLVGLCALLAILF